MSGGSTADRGPGGAAAAAEPVLVDVRTPSEYREVHVPGSLNVPLADIDRLADDLSARVGGHEVVLLCRTGRRAETARCRLAARGFDRVRVHEGGVVRWIEDGGEVERGAKGMSIERQVRIAAGSLVLLGIGLGVFVHAAFLGLSAFVGAGLVFAGITDTCGMAMLLGRLPFNRVEGVGTTSRR